MKEGAMPDLFNPTLPGSVYTTRTRGWVSAGWVPWDDLSEDARAAHGAAVADAAASTAEEQAEESDALPEPDPSEPDTDLNPDPDPAPAAGDVPKE